MIRQNPTTHGFDPYRSDVGWFGSKLVKKAAAVVRKVPGTSLITSQVALAGDIARGRNVIGAVRKQGRFIAADARRSAPIAASVVSFVPGVGTGVAAGLNAASAVAQGRGLKGALIAAGQGALPGGALVTAAGRAVSSAVRGDNLLAVARSAASGVVPENIMRAVDFGADVIRGKNVLKTVLAQAAKQFAPGSPELGGFNAAKLVLTSAAPTAQALASARKTLTSEGARRAFDAAVGEAAKAAAQHKPTRASLVANPATRRLMRLGSGKVGAQFRPLTARAAQVVATRQPSVSLGALFGRHETAGLESDGAAYRVENGDNAWAIAKKLTKDGNRWRELVKANPQKKTNPKDGNFATLFAGEKLTLPASWRQSVGPVLKADTLSQARAILKVWSDSDGASEAGVTDYGNKPEDSSLTWGPRDRLLLISFLNWRQRTANKRLQAGGDLTDIAADELRLWAAEHAASANAPAVPVPVASVPTPAEPTVRPSPLEIEQAAEGNGPYAQGTPFADLSAMATAAQASGDPVVMRRVANELAKKYPGQSPGSAIQGYIDKLNAAADKAEAQQFGVPDPTAQVLAPMTVVGTVPKQTASKSDGAGLLLVGALAFAKVAGLF